MLSALRKRLLEVYVSGVNLGNVEFQDEDGAVWIIWMGKDHTKLYNDEAKKLLDWLKKVVK